VAARGRPDRHGRLRARPVGQRQDLPEGQAVRKVQGEHADGRRSASAAVRESGLKATFVVPEAEVNSDTTGVEVVWRDLRQLLQAAEATGPVVALSHSAGYRTVAWWLHDPISCTSA